MADTDDSPDIWVMSVFEHQRLQVSDFRYRCDFEWLLTQEFDVFSIKRQRGQWQLKVGHYIGIIILPSRMTLEILPKTLASTIENQDLPPPNAAIKQTRHWVQQMLFDLLNAHHTGSKFPHHKNMGQVSTQLAPLPLASAPLSEWLVKQFVQLLSVYQPTPQYQTHTQNQATLQGKLLIKQQLRQNSMQPHKFVSEISTLSRQTPANRLIKSALLLIQPLLQPPLFSTSLAIWQPITGFSPHELHQLDSLYLMATRKLQTQPATPQQQQVGRQVLAWAYGLLQWQHSSVHTGHSVHPQQIAANTMRPRLCLLINMHQAFEQWATARIAARFSAMNVSAINTENNHTYTHYQSLIQPRHVWLRDHHGQSRLAIQPDLLIYQSTVTSPVDSTDNAAANDLPPASQSRQCSHVIDIKWKRLAASGTLSASDAYQLTSYAQAYQAPQVWLVYPVTEHREPMVLKQQNDAANPNHNPNPAELWLMPFNVFTGNLNNDLQPQPKKV